MKAISSLYIETIKLISFFDFLTSSGFFTLIKTLFTFSDMLKDSSLGYSVIEREK